MCQGPSLKRPVAMSGGAKHLLPMPCTAVLPHARLVRMCADWGFLCSWGSVTSTTRHGLSFCCWCPRSVPNHNLLDSSLQGRWASYPLTSTRDLWPIQGLVPPGFPSLGPQGQATSSLCCLRVRHVCRSNCCSPSSPHPAASSRPGHSPRLSIRLFTFLSLSVYSNENFYATYIKPLFFLA